MTGTLEVRASHIVNELIRVEFAQSQIVSDHPTFLGGTGKGPTPAALLLAALASSSALAGRKWASAHGLPVAYIGARMGQRIDQEGFAAEHQQGPLPALSYVGALWRRLEVEGHLSAEERENLRRVMTETGVAAAVRSGVSLDERFTYRHVDTPPRPLPEKNAVHLTQESKYRLPSGETRTIIKAENWRLSASAIQDDMCVINLATACLTAGDAAHSGKGPSPEEFLLGALASCTAIFVARNAGLHEIPIDSVDVVARAALPASSNEPITRIEKICEVRGNLTKAQVEKLEHCATFCAIGVSLLRGVPINDDFVVEARDVSMPGGRPLAALWDNPAAPAESLCDDQSCCMPTQAA